MLDFGWAEMLIIIAVGVFVIGPDEIPAIMLTLGRVMRRLQYVRYAFTQQFDDFMKEADLNDIRKSVNFEAKDFDEAAADEEMIELDKQAENPEPSLPLESSLPPESDIVSEFEKPE